MLTTTFLSRQAVSSVENFRGQWLSAGETESLIAANSSHNIRMIGPHNGVFRNIKNRHAIRFLARLFPGGRDWFDIHAML